MKFRTTLFVAFAILASLFAVTSARAQATCRPGTACYAAQTQPVRYVQVQPVRYVQAAPATVTYQATQTITYQGDDPASFLAALNAHRARYGRGPVGWDPNLAAWAASNNGVHAAHSMHGRAGQCWAGTRSYMHALRMWIASPAHNAILLNATSAVGCSPCPTGMTLNAN